MDSLRIGQVLITITNEKVRIVGISNTSICVSYDGKKYIRSRDVIGVKLFVIEDVNIHKDEVRIASSTDFVQTNIYIPVDNIETLENTCKNCMQYRRDDCFGGENICKQFKNAPEIQNWFF